MDREVFGRSFWKIHQAMDKPYWVFGRRHRVMFHDSVSAAAIAQKKYPGDDLARRAALYHIYLDEMCSKDPLFKAKLALLADMDSRRRAQMRRQRRVERNRKDWIGPRYLVPQRKRKIQDTEREFMEFLRKAQQIEFMARELSKRRFL